MILKEPSPCCASPTLTWFGAKTIYVCPCGKMRAHTNGRLIVDRAQNFKYGSKAKSAASTNPARPKRPW